MTVQRGDPQDDALPEARVRWVHTVRTSKKRTTRIVIITCPLCSRLHVHRWPWYAVEPGDRLSHCRRGRYRLVVAE